MEDLTQKLDKKSNKVGILKKTKHDNEIKITKLKSTIDNMKTFLKLLNNNFIKSMKNQNQSLKEQFSDREKDFIKEIDLVRSQINQQIHKVIFKKEKEY